MRLRASLAFICVMLSAVSGLRCYTCWSVNPGTCHQVWTCPDDFDRCSTTLAAENLVTKKCMKSEMCGLVYSDGVTCCSGDLCNGAKHSGVFVPLLLAPLAFSKLFI